MSEPLAPGNISPNFCPVLFSLGVFPSEDGWCVRQPTRDVHLQAPDGYLNLVQRWCDGRTSWTDVQKLAARHWANNASGTLSGFRSFVDSLIAEGVVVDAGRVLCHAKQLADNPNDWGRSVPADAWPALQAQLRSLPEDGDAVQWLGDMGSAGPSGWAAMSRQRRSCYGFSHEPLSRAELLALLASYAVTSAPIDSVDGVIHRAVPSGGGLYRLSLFLVLLRPLDATLPAGLWRVEYLDAGGIGLHRINAEDATFLEKTYRACLAPHNLDGASAWLVVSADLMVIAAKYRNRAVGHAYLEAGAVMQNLALIAAECGLGQLPLSAFDEERVASLFGLADQVPLISIVLGKPRPVQARRDSARRVRWTQTLSGLPHHLAIAWPQNDSPQGPSNICFGRDTNALRAYQKAMCEAVERDAMAMALPTLRWASLDALQREAQADLTVIDPRQVLRFSERQYKLPGFPLYRFDSAAILPWVRMDDLMASGNAWMLADFVTRRSAMPVPCTADPLSKPYTFVNSSGCAASPSRHHALQNALLELIERDAFMRFWMSRRYAVRLDFDRAELGADTTALYRRLTKEGCRVVLLRLATPWAHVVLSVAQHPALKFTLCGAGADWTLAGAAHKAMGEIATGVLARLAGVQTRAMTPEAVRYPVDHLHLYCQPDYFRRADFLFEVPPQAGMPEEPLVPDSLQSLLAAFKRAGQRAYVAWQPEEGLPKDYKNRPIHVARVVAPGLVPIAFGAFLMPLGMGIALHDGWDGFPHPFP
ncbi:YcaO-like family protein [Polaromonas sp.]|uniref:YcaO-like family protein n=1 Tax=Polaromonas sp. TaxID=1869339 RepID=UPI003753E50B